MVGTKGRVQRSAVGVAALPSAGFPVNDEEEEILSRKLTSSILAVCAAAAVAVLWVLPASAKPTALRATTITVTAGKPSEFSFTLSKKSAPAGAITFKVTNGGAIPHDFKLCSSPKGTTKPNTCAGKSTPMLSPGAMGFKSLIVTLKAKGTYEYMCTVPGHAAGGMKGVFKVT